ncbi:MAG: M12 family metallo-peptidase [Planctomycetaceae bacterium]|nr:M12 family metallo-peptidase [Planctomycetaceae bacterium]
MSLEHCRIPVRPALALGLTLGCLVAGTANLSAAATIAEPGMPTTLSSNLPKVSNKPVLEPSVKAALRNLGASIAPHGPIEAPPEVASAFNLLRGTAFNLAPAAIGDFGLIYFTVVDPRTGAPLDLELRPTSVRAPGFKLIAHNAANQPIEMPAPAPATVGGVVSGVEGSRVAGSYRDGRLTLAIFLPDGARINIDPMTLALPDALPGDHIAYMSEDIAPHDGHCGVDHDHEQGGGDGGNGGIFGGGDGGIAGDGGTAGVACDVQMLIDCDFPFYNRAGGTVLATADRSETIVAISNQQYINQVGIRHLISGLVVRNTAGSDPYTGASLCTGGDGDLLTQTTVYWTNVQGSPYPTLDRDMVHMFTGRISGGTIGCAWVGDVCGNTTDYVAHGVSAIDYVVNTALSTDLFAHEAGHNWGAGHCTCSSPASTMNPWLTGANTFTNAPSIGEITGWRAGHSSCFDCAASQSDGCGDERAGSAWSAHASPYSSNANCCAIVCALDAFCCGIEWDSICANRALSTCIDCGTPGAGSPYIAHENPGCNDLTCCAKVCSEDPYCCNTTWDGYCVSEAESLCRSGMSCADARLIFTASSLQFNTGEAAPAADISSCGTGDTRAVWRKIIPVCGGVTRIRVCTDFAEAQIVLTVFSSCGGEEIACSTTNFSGCGSGNVHLDVLLGTGQYYYLRIATVGGATAAGSLEISCNAVCGTGGSCTSAQPFGSKGCAVAECCATVCNIDPYCCDTSWDIVCAGEAVDLCFRPGDLDRDGDVDAADLSMLLASWGGAAGDVNGDGTTDAADLSALLANWG